MSDEEIEPSPQWWEESSLGHCAIPSHVHHCMFSFSIPHFTDMSIPAISHILLKSG